ncbi:MAG TPA: bifunctional phosphoribosylaminoimidazolecarboxamide formyltransferase/IMP cyclohydrolase [Bacteriovoracaceae bacterium]|nr:bifunctional phosphoribosylaminoimidazolecarboxamide formyltransferase/IMP cyclohydrolase [Bacteriovoracaceae bacterium]
MTKLLPKRALISVSDKTNLELIVPVLAKLGVELISTGGTAEFIKGLGLEVTAIQDVTGNPEAFGGRMKSISFQVSSSLLYRRDHPDDLREARQLGITPIDLVICNLYPFEDVSRKAGVTTQELIENIDVGGPSMVRAAAKNMNSVTVLTDPADYQSVVDALLSGGTGLEQRTELAIKAFSLTARYDLAIALCLSREFKKDFPEVFSRTTRPLRYGENPHQRAKLHLLNNQAGSVSLAAAPVLQGKEISYNNYLDSDQAYKCVSELQLQFPQLQHCVIVKHGIPCGAASSGDQLLSLQKAWASDPVSAFGGIISFSRDVSHQTAQWLSEYFIELVIAPGFSSEALEVFSKKKNVRLVKVPMKPEDSREWTLRSINGGILWQEEDERLSLELKTVTKNPFLASQLQTVRFGLIISKYMKSNCLLLADHRDGAFQILAGGVGQPNRLECLTLLAGPRLKEKKLELGDAILFSDAFFPFTDTIEEAHQWGVRYVVQPGGSIKDPEVIAACDGFGMAMILTGERHFRH